MSRAHELDPLSRQIGVEWGWVSYLMHRNDEAEAHIRQTLALDPNYAQGYMRLGFVQVQQQRYPEAIASLKRALDLGGYYPQSSGPLAFAYARSGNRAEVMRILDELKQRKKRGEIGTYFAIAGAYAGLGDLTQGIEWLKRGIDVKDIYIPENFFDPLLDPLREDPRFDQMLVRMGLKPAGPDSGGQP